MVNSIWMNGLFCIEKKVIKYIWKFESFMERGIVRYSIVSGIGFIVFFFIFFGFYVYSFYLGVRLT